MTATHYGIIYVFIYFLKKKKKSLFPCLDCESYCMYPVKIVIEYLWHGRITLHSNCTNMEQGRGTGRCLLGWMDGWMDGWRDGWRDGGSAFTTLQL